MSTLYNPDPGSALYVDSKGSPLNGIIYFGVPNLNPVTNPATVYWDAAGTQPAAQPIAVSNGRTVRQDGTPSQVWISGDYSKLAVDGGGRQVVFEPNQQSPLIPQTATVDTFSGTGASATYTLSVAPSSKNDTSVFVGGVYQEKSSYTLAGKNLTINAALGANNVEVVTTENLDWTSVSNTINTAVAISQTASNTATTEAGVATTQAANAAAAAAAAQSYVSPVSVADYTGLRAYNGTAVMINVTGYLVTSAPSGIAGTFTRDDHDTTTADDGGTVIVDVLGRRWKRVYSGAVSVMWFGAKGDGTTDDSAAIQSALNTYESVEFDRHAVYLSGNLSISQVGVVPGQGDGIRDINFNGATLLLKAGSSWALKIQNSDFVNVRNIKLDMNNVANAKGIWHSGGWCAYVENVQSNLATVATSSYDLYVDGGTQPPSYGAGVLWGAYSSEYHNCYFARVNLAGAASGGYVTTLNFFNLSAQAGTGVGGTAVTIANCGTIHFYSPILQTSTNAFAVSGSSNIHVYSCYVEGCVNYFAASGTVSNVVSVNGQLSLSGAYVSGTISGQYLFDDNPIGQQRLQYTGDITRGKNGYVERYSVQNNTLNNASSDYVTVEPGGWGNATGVGAHQFMVAGTSPLIGKYVQYLNRGNQAVVAWEVDWDTGTGQPWFSMGANQGAPTAAIDTAGYNIRIRASNTPATSAAAGNPGEIRWDANYLYVCVALNTWKRLALVAF